MTKHAAVVAIAALLSACASAPPPKPPTTEELLLGTWTCQSNLQGQADITSVITYVKGGSSTFKLNVKAAMGAMSLELDGEGTGAWRLLEGDNLENKVSDVTVKAAKMNGNPVDVAMIQGMANQMLANQSSTAPIKVTKTTMTETTKEGAATNCTRPAA